jgi:hypothetical protein
MISFRISEDDYQLLLQSSRQINVGTASLAAREMVCGFLRSGGDLRGVRAADSLKKIEDAMSELKGQLRSLKDE